MNKVIITKELYEDLYVIYDVDRMIRTSDNELYTQICNRIKESLKGVREMKNRKKLLLSLFTREQLVELSINLENFQDYVFKKFVADQIEENSFTVLLKPDFLKCNIDIDMESQRIIFNSDFLIVETTFDCNFSCPSIDWEDEFKIPTTKYEHIDWDELEEDFIYD